MHYSTNLREKTQVAESESLIWPKTHLGNTKMVNICLETKVKSRNSRENGFTLKPK